MDNISLVTFAAKTVTPQDDALIYESALGAGGIIYGAEVTQKNANTLHISAGHGVIAGRKFTIFDSDIPVVLSTVGQILGRLYIHMDLSNASEPIELLVETGQSLSPLVQDEDVNIVNGEFDINLASFTVSTSTIDNLRNVYPKVKYANSGSIIRITTEEPSLIGEEVSITDGTDYVYAVFNAEGVAELANVLMTGTLTVTATDGTDEASATLNVPYYGTYELDVAFWNATLNITTSSPELYGQTISVYDSNNVFVGSAMFSGSGTAQFIVKEPDTYTLSVDYGGTTYTATVTVTTQTTYNVQISTIPDGSTVTPTDDIQTWLHCAGIYNKTYTTIAQVLADITTLLALVNDNNAADYMARSTTWASAVTADQTAMTYIGADDYCADALLADSTWQTAICNSTYFEIVLNVKVPAMTSNTTPSGVVSYANLFTSTGDFANPWKVFSGSVGPVMPAQNNTNSGRINYEFPSNTKIYLVKNEFNGVGAITANYVIEAEENSSWTLVLSEKSATKGNSYSYVFDNPIVARKYSLRNTNAWYTSDYTFIARLQYYGRAAT